MVSRTYHEDFDMTDTFHGAWPALITPATADGEVNCAVLRDLVEYLIGKGIGGLYVCGSTGEGLQLSVEERVQVDRKSVV